MPESFKKGPLGRTLLRLQPEEWQLYTVIPDRVDGDNIVYGYFHLPLKWHSQDRPGLRWRYGINSARYNERNPRTSLP